MCRGLDLNNCFQTTLLTVALKTDKYLDLTGINLSPQSIVNTDKTPTVEENVDLGLDSANIICPSLRAAAVKTTSASSALSQANVTPVDTHTLRGVQIKQGKGIEIPATAVVAP